MEPNANENVIWPFSFQMPTQNKGAHSVVSDDEQVPWLIGVDGRNRGSLTPFPGISLLGYPPTSYTGTVTVNSFATAVGQLTIGQTSTAISFDETGAGSNNTAALNLTTLINVAGGSVYSATRVNNVITITWQTGFGYGAGFTLATTAPGVSVTASMTPVYAGDADTSISARYVKYAAIRLATGGLLRGYVVQDRAGTIRYYYKYGDASGEAFTDFIEIHTGTSAYKLGITTYGRMLYVVGCNAAGTAFAKVVLNRTTGTRGPLLTVYNAGAYGDAALGAGVLSAGSSSSGNLRAGWYQFVYRYFDTIRQRRTVLSYPIDAQYADDDSAIFQNNSYASADPFHPTTNTASGPFDTVEIYSSISSLDAGEHASQPYYRRGVKTLGGDTFQWTFSKYAVSVPDDSLTDDALSERGLIYDGSIDIVNSQMPTLEDLAFFNGANFGLEPANEFLDIRWSPLYTTEPENMPLLNAKRTQIRSGSVAHFRQAGDYLWVLGDGESYKIQKKGSSLGIYRMLEGISVVGPRASCSVGGTIFAVTTQGVISINAETGDYQQIAAADRIIFSRWAKNLTNDTPYDPTIFVTYDSELATVTIYNRNCGEAVILWLTTNRVTHMVDMWYEYAFEGRVTNVTGAQRSMFISDVPTITPRSYGGQFLYYRRHRLQQTSAPNMIGATTGVGGEFPNGLIVSPVAVTLDTTSIPGTDLTKIEFASSLDLTSLTGRSRVTGAVLYDLAAPVEDEPIRGYKVIDSDQNTTTDRVECWIYGDHTTGDSAITTSSVISIAPVVVAICMSPLPGNDPGDLLFRRVTNGMVCVIADSDEITTSSDAILYYGMIRGNNVGDSDILDAVTGDPMNYSANPLPFTASWLKAVGTNTELDNSAPKQMYGYFVADGGILHPMIACLRSGDWYELVGGGVLGRVSANKMVALHGSPTV